MTLRNSPVKRRGQQATPARAGLSRAKGENYRNHQNSWGALCWRQSELNPSLQVARAKVRAWRRPAALEPIAAVGDPPAQDHDGERRQQSPHQRKSDVHHQAEHEEDDPEGLLLHGRDSNLVGLVPSSSVRNRGVFVTFGLFAHALCQATGGMVELVGIKTQTATQNENGISTAPEPQPPRHP